MKSVREMDYWMPEGEEDFLSLIPARGKPKTKEHFLLDQSQLLEMLIEEACPEEIEDANNRLKDNLSPTYLMNLPAKLFNDEDMAVNLILGPAEDGSALQAWRREIPEMLTAPEASPEAANSRGRKLSLEGFLSRLGV